MEIKDKIVFKWELSGIFFIIIFGSLFHFFYDWSGKSPIVGLFAPVNESVWEHLKLGFWSVVIFSSIEYWFIRDRVNNFVIAKAAGIISMELFIVVFFYTYTALIGKHIFILDILSYILGAILCQIISYRILLKGKLSHFVHILSISFFLIYASLLMLFTYFTPELPIFLDKNTNTYGANWN